MQIKSATAKVSPGDKHRLTCAEVKDVTEQHIADIRLKVKDLNRLARVLSNLAARCRGDYVPECLILEALAAPRNQAIATC